MTVVWSFPTRIVYGAGSLEGLADEARRHGLERVLLVTDPQVETLGLAGRAAEVLSRGGLAVSTYVHVSQNPLESEVLGAADAARHAGATGFVAVGGGSVIDVAKLARLALSRPLPLAPYAVGGTARIEGSLPPLFAVPTTAGSGSEVSASALVTVQSTTHKTLFSAPSLLPTVAVLDPSLTTSLSPRLTAATGMAALARCVEAYCAPVDHPMADAIALNGIAQALSGLERAVQDGQLLDARGAMQKASMMGAVAAQKGLGACDSLAHALATEAGMQHGIACSIVLPHVLDVNRGAVPEKLAKLARLFGVRGDDVDTLAFECAGAVRALRKRIGLPDHLAVCQVDASQVPRIAAAAAADPSNATNPRPCTEQDFARLLQAAL